MTRYLLGAATFLAGLMAAMQPPINAGLSRRTGSLEAATISFAVGFVIILAAALLVGRGSFGGIKTAPWWQLTGGIIGATFVWVNLVMVTHLGLAGLLAGSIAGQLVGGLAIDHFGLFGLPQNPITAVKLLGIGLLAAGAFLVLRR
jgi:bacterial/archaeal transporter family-2 protein